MNISREERKEADMAILDKVKEVGNQVARKSGEMVETGKLSYNISKKEKEIRSSEFRIGTLVYNQYKEGQTFSDDIVDLCRQIDEEYIEKARLENEKEAVGLDDVDVEVVDADIPADEDFEVSEEDDEILKEL